MIELVFCLKCGECLGEHRPYFAKAHIEAFPNHLSFLPKTIIDPLALSDLDSYIERLNEASSRRRLTLSKQPKGYQDQKILYKKQ